MFKTALLSLAALGSSALEFAQVHDYITDAVCKENYISKHRPACVTEDGKCHPHKSGINDCRDVDTWQWWHKNDKYLQFAPGVLPPAPRRIVHNGDAKGKLVWAYTGAITQGLAYQIYGPNEQVTPDDLLNTPCNQISFIANVQVDNPGHWFNPGKNDSNGCGQKQTWELPFGFSGHSFDHGTIERFQQNLTRIHQGGVTITMVMGSWCTSFPVVEWSESQFSEFVNYFKTLREGTFGGNLDGVDFDWEGYCNEICLKGNCQCDWDDKVCSDKSPEELAAGVKFTRTDSHGNDYQMECYIMPTKATIQVITGIAHYMKQAGFVVTLVPMSTAVYTSKEDSSAKQNMRNEYVKWRKNTFDGQEVDLMEIVDAVLLQWYSGFDASLCTLSDDPHACSCDNVQLMDEENYYPNVHNNSRHGPNESGFLYAYKDFEKQGGNMWPSTWPARCQGCGKNVILEDGTRGEFPCVPEGSGEDWALPGNIVQYPELITQHQNGFRNYSTVMGQKQGGGMPAIAYWWLKGMEQGSRCPRAVDCPDFRYKNEEPYSRQVKLLKDISSVVDLSKVAIGFETLGTDVLVQQASYADPTQLWSTASVKEHENGVYFHKCTQNMTRENVLQTPGHRCGSPVLEQQWGHKFNASEIIGLFAAVNSATGKELAGVGTFTLDGMMYVGNGRTERIWYKPLCDLNKNFQIKCQGPCCTQEHFDTALPSKDAKFEMFGNAEEMPEFIA